MDVIQFNNDAPVVGSFSFLPPKPDGRNLSRPPGDFAHLLPGPSKKEKLVRIVGQRSYL